MPSLLEQHSVHEITKFCLFLSNRSKEIAGPRTALKMLCEKDPSCHTVRNLFAKFSMIALQVTG